MRPDDERLVERLRRGWGRPTSSPAERATFDAELRARLDRRQVRVALPLAVGVAAAVVVVLMLWRWAPPPPRAFGGTPSWVALAADGAGVPVATAGDEDGLGVAYYVGAADGGGTAGDDVLDGLVTGAGDDDLGSLLPSRLVGLARLLEPPARTAEELGD